MFLNHIHEKRYNHLIELAKTPDYDTERMAYIYIISSCDELYEIREQLYDFQTDFPRFVEIDELDLHPAMSKLLYIAFSLYNGHNPDNYSLVELFGKFDDSAFNVAVNAMKIRFLKG
ncbi:DUF6075 family protein [Oceanirhabdus sp. W0125-5]|uniref:DUF6075 family protein n=1 Tax=Oceanirhabdus sp. W0125-5 TaxID=2999116 RepID=UPI0022F2BA3E|nr:DUF6075 family protein [Oceanirhabdus sp. W0125-5]WBW95798.1 DUF6075 family protein [Oceanirhabdus sp. W0125-5]